MSKTIVGRSKEKEKLSLALKSSRSELIAVYGRRRIGKTHLIRNFYNDKIIFSFTGLQTGTRADQIENFMLKLNEVSYEFRKEKPKSWLEALHLLKIFLTRQKETDNKMVIFIDEFPWVDSHKSKFLPAFENFWNDYCTTRNDLIVVVCGSAASYIIKNIIQNRGGLYNRITSKIKLEPFSLYETELFLKYKKVKMKRNEILKIYMAFGGIAEYLQHIESGDSSVTAIQRLCFEKGALLENEYSLVFKSLFAKGSYHEKIIQILVNSKKMGLTRDELIEQMDVSSGGRFSSYLEELIQTGFVQKYEAYIENYKATLFRIYDEFCLFHLQFMTQFKNNNWQQIYTKQTYKTWCGYAFEMICLKHVNEIKNALKCDQIQSDNYAWRNANAQIDLVIDRDDNIVNLCEIKFFKGEFSIDDAYFDKLLKKEIEFEKTTVTKKTVHTVLLTTWGIKQNENSRAIVAQEVIMDGLFKMV